jgi:hypothetical protein
MFATADNLESPSHQTFFSLCRTLVSSLNQFSPLLLLVAKSTSAALRLDVFVRPLNGSFSLLPLYSMSTSSLVLSH